MDDRIFEKACRLVAEKRNERVQRLSDQLDKWIRRCDELTDENRMLRAELAEARKEKNATA
jgi:uncharacterized membrane protein